MPYIENKDKHEMSDAIDQLMVFIESKGDLNYAICELVGRLILHDDKISYTTISNWIDGVDGAEKELTRRILNAYEDIKILENGDVPSFIKILEEIQPPKF
jgi:hypothetical protein